MLDSDQASNSQDLRKVARLNPKDLLWDQPWRFLLLCSLSQQIKIRKVSARNAPEGGMFLHAHELS